MIDHDDDDFTRESRYEAGNEDTGYLKNIFTSSPLWHLTDELRTDKNCRQLLGLEYGDCKEADTHNNSLHKQPCDIKMSENASVINKLGHN